MDIVFKCPHCRQELEVDAGASGQPIDCPSCSKKLTIPEPDPTNLRVGIAGHTGGHTTNAGARELKSLSVPLSDKPVQPLIQKALPTLDTAKGDGTRQLRIKTIRHSDCREVGHDNFDKLSSEFLQRIGEENIVSINTFAYTYIDIGSQKLLTDFGVLVVYKG
jgi:hypothetical protein